MHGRNVTHSFSHCICSELVGEYRRVGKEIRELEAQIKQEEARLMAQAKTRGSPSITRRRRSGALLDAEWDTMAVTRTQKVQKAGFFFFSLSLSTFQCVFFAVKLHSMYNQFL